MNKAREIIGMKKGQRLSHRPTRIEVYTTGTHAHGTYAEWSNWLRAQFLTR